MEVIKKCDTQCLLICHPHQSPPGQPFLLSMLSEITLLACHFWICSSHIPTYLHRDSKQAGGHLLMSVPGGLNQGLLEAEPGIGKESVPLRMTQRY